MERNYWIHLSTNSSRRYTFLALYPSPTGLIFNNIVDAHFEEFLSDTSLIPFLVTTISFGAGWKEDFLEEILRHRCDGRAGNSPA